MSIQWVLASLFLYAEIIFVICLLVPGIDPKRWKTFFNSRVIEVINRKAHLFFNFTIVVLTVFLLDAVREIIRTEPAAEITQSTKDTLDLGSTHSVREIRSQRNLYISGMALFLWFVIKRLVVLISTNADLVEDYELADRECKELRRELDTVQLKYTTYTAVLSKETSSSTEEALAAAENAADKLANERTRSRSRGKKEL